MDFIEHTGKENQTEMSKSAGLYVRIPAILLINAFCQKSFKRVMLSLLITVTTMGAEAAPVLSEVADGKAAISQADNITTIHQQTPTLSLNWHNFNIAEKESVNFIQPSASALAVNRVSSDHQASQIEGHLNANGQVWLINPNGVMFGKNARVNVGGLLVSTLEIAHKERNKFIYKFSGTGTAKIVNKGQIQTAQAGYVAMLADAVSNEGEINTPQGSTALAAGHEVQVTFVENQLTDIHVSQSTLNNLVENKQVIRANGGRVIMTAGARDSLLSSAVNNHGIVEAQSIKNHKGTIILLSGMQAGTTMVNGTLNASAPNGGEGGAIETSGNRVEIDPKVKITTLSQQGMNGKWTIDPQDYTIAKVGGDITGTQLSALLANNNIIIASMQGQKAGSGDLTVSDAISWGNTNTITLQAERNVNFNAGGDVTNTTGGTVNVRADAEGTGTGTIVMNGGSIKLSGKGTINFYYNPQTFGTPSTFDQVTGEAGTTFTAYMLINTPSQLMAIEQHQSQSYALAKDIDLSQTTFNPIASFAGTLDGQNYSISHLKITGNKDDVGLFNNLSATSKVKNLKLEDVDVSGQGTVGALAASNYGEVENINVSGTVSGTGSNIGGVFGLTQNDSSGTCIVSSVTVQAKKNSADNNPKKFVGGLAGSISGGTYSNDVVTGKVTAVGYEQVGGFAGFNNTSATIKNSSSAGNVDVESSSKVGGFIGLNAGKVTGSHAKGNVTVQLNSAAATDSDEGKNIGGFIGYNDNTQLQNDYASGNIKITSSNNDAHKVEAIGGLVGRMLLGSIEHSYATGNVDSQQTGRGFGGLVGLGAVYLLDDSKLRIKNVYASGDVSAQPVLDPESTSGIGGLVGILEYDLTKSEKTDGLADRIIVENTYSVGKVTGPQQAMEIGGLLGRQPVAGIITNDNKSFWDKTTSTQQKSAGGDDIVGRTTQEMQTESVFIEGKWDFDTVWKMGTGGYRYPVFKDLAEPPSCPTAIQSYYPFTLNNLHAEDKTYDGNNVATISKILKTGILPQHQVSVTAVGNFSNANVGKDKEVIVSAATLSGPDAGKYVVVPDSATTTATIIPRKITVTAQGKDKIYDGNTSASVTLDYSAQIIPGTEVSFDYAAANFASANPGVDIPIRVTGIAAKGTDAANYLLLNLEASTSANILYPIIPISPTKPVEPTKPAVSKASSYPQQSIVAALQKPLTGCLYNSYDKPLTGCLFQIFKKPVINRIGSGVRLLKFNSGQ